MFVCHASSHSSRHNGDVAQKSKKKTKGAKKRTRVSFLEKAQSFFAGSSVVRNPAFKWVRNIGVGTISTAIVISLFVFPIRDYFVQRSALAARDAEFETLADANERLQIEVNKLQTPEGIRAAARAQLGYVLPGEQRISVSKMPELPTQLPEVWPYTMVSDIVSVRAEQAQKADGALSPLAP